MVDDTLGRSESHLAAAQRITHCGSWELDLENLTELDANRLQWSDEVFRIFGYEPGAIEVTNQNFFRAVHPDDRERIAIALRASIENGKPFAIDHRVVRPDGSVRIVHEESEIQADASGRPRRMIGTVQDVTDLRLTESQLMFRDRMASVGTLAAGVAHEINNPLAGVCVNLEMLTAKLAELGRRTELPRELENYLRNATEGADRIRDIVRDLMLFSRADDMRREPSNVTSVLESALRMAFHEIKHRANVIREYHDVPPVHANEARLAQVFVNLLRNAAHAIPDGDPDRHHIRLHCATDATGRIVVTIGDTGCGIPSELQSQVFSPFFTTKTAGEGTGLGLSISRRIVTDLGGTISFTSEVGRGTEFRITLPAATPPPPPPAPERPAAPERPTRRSVLIIDDERLVTNALNTVLSREHDVTVLNDPLEARDVLVGSARFDVILCDLIMPKLNGMELYAHLMQVAPETADRMILMTGGASSETTRDFLATSGAKWIDKPFQVDKLRQMIAQLATRS